MTYRLTCVLSAGLLALAFGGCGGGGASGAECGNGVCEDGEDGASCPDDCPVCDDDGYCEVAAGENGLNCPGDCPICLEDGVCNREGGENGLNCPADCVICLVDGFCDTAAGEDQTNCAADCTGCNDDGVCDPTIGETTANCPGDCPICNNDGVCDTADGETRANCPADCPICNDNGTCEPAEGESSANCPGDCGNFVDVCDLAAMQAGPAPSDFLVNNLYLPITTAEAATIGVDIDGDGTIDNKLGIIMNLIIGSGGDDPNPTLNGDIAQGDLVVPIRLYVDAWTGDATIMGLAYEGEPMALPPAFDGSDVVDIAPGSPTDIHMCGPYTNGAVALGPGQLLVPVPLFSQTVFVPLQEAQVVGPVSQTAFTDVMIGGGLTPTDIDTTILPALLTYFNTSINADPTGAMATTLMQLFDAQCVDGIPGCSGVVNGTGDCTANVATDPNPLTLTELQCNALLDSALAPDVDVDGDGNEDLLSVGVRIQAVRATINTP